MGTLHRLQGTRAGADRHPYAVRIFLLHVNARILQRFLCRRHRILGERLHSLCRLKVHIVFAVEALHFRRQLTLKIRRVKLCNRRETDLPLLHACPKLVHTQPDGRNRTHACNYHSSAHTQTPFLNSQTRTSRRLFFFRGC